MIRREIAMNIAVTYENGQIFRHFGKASAFQIFTVENGAVVSEKLVSVDGPAHSHAARVSSLADNDIQVLLCGGLGEAARQGLEAAGIKVYSGMEGDPAEAVQAYLAGTLSQIPAETASQADSSAARKEDSCGCGSCSDGNCDDEGCENGCGGCGGCGGERQIIFEGKNAGKTVKTHYRGTLNDGTQFDSSYDRGEPLTFTAGVGMMIPGFDQAVVNMNIGEETDIHLTPEMAYGQVDPSAVFTVNISEMPGAETLTKDQRVYLSNQFGQQFPVRVAEKDDTTITFDANHELAGKELNFHIELVAVE
jgi:FKBP-type peptidyl-prolyl cis-trans isomerase 2/predicted Fe-Mo cluster-binding NifX family protein